jgi:hypothetical protein
MNSRAERSLIVKKLWGVSPSMWDIIIEILIKLIILLLMTDGK